MKTLREQGGYILNPVELNAAASALGIGGNNIALLALNRGALDISNVIKYGSEWGHVVGDFLSFGYNTMIDSLCEKMGYE